MAETDIGFFDRTSTQRFIEQFSNGDSFTFFVGAGASVDRGSPSWESLVEELLVEFLDDGDSGSEVTDELKRRFEPAVLGSMVNRLFEARHRPETAIHQLHNEMFRHLYRGWTARDSLSTAIALVALVLRKLGKEVHIVTTNYDDNIEMSESDSPYVAAAAENYGLSFESIADPDEELLARLERENKIPVIHMNGLMTHENERRGTIVFSEQDFLRIALTDEGWTPLVEYLEERFSNSKVLFLGTSLRDGNVVRALLSTVEHADQRFVVEAKQDYEAVDEAVADELMRAWQLRLAHLGVQPVTTDFYGQIRQLVKELSYSASLGREQYHRRRYEVRLREWWTEWQAQSTDADAVFERRHRHQAALAGCITEMIDAGHLPVDVRAKVDLWLRVDPDTRTLALWSTSEAIYSDPIGPHRAPIRLRSRYPVVDAFTSGRISEGFVAGDKPSRWLYSIAVPVTLKDDRWISLPVGVAVLLIGDRAAAEHVDSEVVTDHIADAILACAETLCAV